MGAHGEPLRRSGGRTFLPSVERAIYTYVSPVGLIMGLFFFIHLERFSEFLFFSFFRVSVSEVFLVVQGEDCH